MADLAPLVPEKRSALTPRQQQVLRLQAYGFSYQDISERLGVSVWTVKNHHKLAVRSLQAALGVCPTERVGTSLACYIMGLLNAGMPARDIVRRLREVTSPPKQTASSPAVLAVNDAELAAD